MFVRLRAGLAIVAIAFGASTWLRALHSSLSHAPTSASAEHCESTHHSEPSPATPESHRSCPLCDLIHASALASPEPAPAIFVNDAPREFLVATNSATPTSTVHRPNQPRAPPV